eukprot:Hpha_TRINITY_DN16809_c1_g1::TRINITY_DN16809_c1_g1_i9::g.151837::m.151837
MGILCRRNGRKGYNRVAGWKTTRKRKEARDEWEKRKLSRRETWSERLGYYCWQHKAMPSAAMAVAENRKTEGAEDRQGDGGRDTEVPVVGRLQLLRLRRLLFLILVLVLVLLLLVVLLVLRLLCIMAPRELLGDLPHIVDDLTPRELALLDEVVLQHRRGHLLALFPHVLAHPLHELVCKLGVLREETLEHIPALLVGDVLELHVHVHPPVADQRCVELLPEVGRQHEDLPLRHPDPVEGVQQPAEGHCALPTVLTPLREQRIDVLKHNQAPRRRRRHCRLQHVVRELRVRRLHEAQVPPPLPRQGLNEGGLPRTRHPPEEVCPLVRNAVLRVEPPRPIAQELLEVIHHALPLLDRQHN